MSSTTILELRQEDAFSGLVTRVNGDPQNGIWETTLDVPIQLNAGDQVQVKSVYLDTSIGQSGYISVPSDIPITMTAAMYLTNYEKDQAVMMREPGYSATPRGESEVQQLRLYPLQEGLTPPLNLPKHNIGDNNKWFLSTLTTSDAPTFQIPHLTMVLPKITKARAGGSYVNGSWTFKYTSVEKGAPRFGETFVIDIRTPFRWNDLYKYNPFNCGIRCAESPTEAGVPDFRLDKFSGKDMLRDTSFIWLPTTKPITTGTQTAECQTFSLSFIIPGGLDVVYSPIELAALITDNLSNLEASGQVSIDYELAGKVTNTMVNYPAMNPFLTTVLKNYSETAQRATATGAAIEQVFINADGYQNAAFDPPEVNNPNGNQNGNLQMKYDVQAMLNERIPDKGGGAEPVQAIFNALDYWIGSNQIAMEFDQSVNKLKFTQQHFPIYSGDTITGDALLQMTQVQVLVLVPQKRELLFTPVKVLPPNIQD